MNGKVSKSARPDWGGLFWRVVYFVIGILMLIVGRLWMRSTGDATMTPLLLMMLGIVVVTIAVRQWPHR